jgi:hypothetical protein
VSVRLHTRLSQYGGGHDREGSGLEAPVARLLAEVLEAQGFRDTATRIAEAIERRITVEAPLTGADYQAIFETLDRSCPPTLYGLHRVLLEDERYLRRATGG